MEDVSRESGAPRPAVVPIMIKTPPTLQPTTKLQRRFSAFALRVTPHLDMRQRRTNTVVR